MKVQYEVGNLNKILQSQAEMMENELLRYLEQHLTCTYSIEKNCFSPRLLQLLIR